MINHLQEARQAKGYDSPSFLRKLKADKVSSSITRKSILLLLLVWGPVCLFKVSSSVLWFPHVSVLGKAFLL